MASKIAEDYRRKALLLSERAASTSDARARHALTLMSAAWLKLAENEELLRMVIDHLPLG
jgi:hypothetical protein